MTRDQRLAQLEADLSGGNRVVRMAEIWSRQNNGEPNLARYVDLQTEDLLFLLRERRELRARVLRLEAQVARCMDDPDITQEELEYAESLDREAEDILAGRLP